MHLNETYIKKYNLSATLRQVSQSVGSFVVLAIDALQCVMYDMCVSDDDDCNKQQNGKASYR